MKKKSTVSNGSTAIPNSRENTNRKVESNLRFAVEKGRKFSYSFFNLFDFAVKFLPIVNPFNAPVYHIESTSSTMDEARLLAASGEKHGTVVTADFQEQGRGRIRGRPWLGKAGENLFFTILLRYAGFGAIPQALTLRTGLAVSEAIEEFAAPFGGAGKDRLAEQLRVQIKWPNDVMIGSRKAAGILTESDGKTVYIGIGVNVSQTEFPVELLDKATSIALAFPGFPENARFTLLEKILERLHKELEGGENLWHDALENRLYMKGRRVRFIAGGADSGMAVEGILQGIGPSGEIRIAVEGEYQLRSFVTGELDVYSHH